MESRYLPPIPLEHFAGLLYMRQRELEETRSQLTKLLDLSVNFTSEELEAKLTDDFSPDVALCLFKWESTRSSIRQHGFNDSNPEVQAYANALLGTYQIGFNFRKYLSLSPEKPVQQLESKHA